MQPSRKVSFDFASFWDACVQHDTNNRLDAGKDLAFWERFAPQYDACAGAAGSCEHTLKRLNALMHQDDDLLDIGAGTGRFALPLAHRVRRVTALDHSPAMLNVLQHKMTASQTHNIDLVCDAWETTHVAPHDVVLAAWSLYRQPNLLQALHKMVLSTRRLLLIVAEVKSYPPHRAASERLWPEHYQQEIDTPMHLCFLGTLWQLGVHANMNIVYETRVFQAATRQQLAALLMPDTAGQEDMDRLACEMGTHIEKYNGSYRYNCTEPVALISWMANK